MCKSTTCKCQGNCGCDNPFYLGIADVTYYSVKMENGAMVSTRYFKHLENYEYDYRQFGMKFQKSPALAMFYVVRDKEESYFQAEREKFFSQVIFNEANNSYIFDEYLTIGTHKPAKEHHIELFKKGEYELVLAHYEIQVLQTKPVSVSSEEITKVL